MGDEDFLPIYQRVTDLIHKAARQGRTDLLDKDTLNEVVQDISGGAFKTYAALLDAQNRRNRLISQQEKEAVADPGALATFAGKGFKEGTFGLGPKLLNLMSPNLGGAFESGLETGGAAHPAAELGGDIFGSLVSGYGAGRAVGSALPLPGLPNTARAGIQGGAAAGLTGLASGLGSQPGTEFDVGKALPQAGISALLGFGFGAGTEKLMSIYNAASDRIHDLVSKSAPSQIGAQAGVRFSEGIRELERISNKFSGVLKRPVALLTNRFKSALQNVSRRSPTAAEDALTALNKLEQTVDAAYKRIANNPKTGYPRLDKIDLAANPVAKEIAREQGYSGPLTARWLEDTKQQLRSRLRTLKIQKEQGLEKVNNRELTRLGKTVDRINGVLDEVPGYQELRAQVAPYLQYLQEIRKMRTAVARARPRASPLIEKGSIFGAPKDAVKGMAGLDASRAQERTARSMLEGLMKGTPAEMIEAVNPPLGGFLHTPEAVAGGVAGSGAGLLYRRFGKREDEE